MESPPDLAPMPATFRVATWNMEYAFRRQTQDESWHFLWDAVQPHVALVQEAVPSPDLNAVWREEGIDLHRPWASAVVSRTLALTPVTVAKSGWYRYEVSILKTHPGSVAVATMPLPTGEVLTAISIYGLIVEGYASATVHRQLTDLYWLFDDERYNKHVVLGGDLNAGTQGKFGDLVGHRSAMAVERIQNDFGLVDCLDRTLGESRLLPNCPCHQPVCRHVRTQRYKNNPQSKPWQSDYLFASSELADRLVACYALDDERAWALSSHCPVVAEFTV